MKLSFISLLACSLFLTSSCLSRRNLNGKDDAASLKVMSYNVHHCNPPAKPGVIDVDAIAAVINEEKPDLVGLQEIDVYTGRSGKGLNQAQALGAKTGMNFYFGKAIDHDGGEYGVAILSKFPISEPKVYPLTSIESLKGEPRVLLTAKITLPSGKVIRFANTHLDATRDQANRMAQMKDINAIALKDELPFLITGDFNASPESAVIRSMDAVFQRTCLECEATIPADKPTKSIDFIGFKKSDRFVVSSHKVIAVSLPSDHLPVVATLSVK